MEQNFIYGINLGSNAVVRPGAVFKGNNSVGHSSYVVGGVLVGANTKIGVHSIIHDGVEIGKDSIVMHHVVDSERQLSRKQGSA